LLGHLVAIWFLVNMAALAWAVFVWSGTEIGGQK